MAQFVVSGGTVTNNVTTTTVPGTNTNPNAGANSQSTQQFNQFVIGNNTATGVIQGDGLALISNNSYVNMTNNGSINVNVFHDALFLGAPTGGTVTYTGSGSITNNTASGNGLEANALGINSGGQVTINTSGTIQGTEGILALSNFAGGVSITTSNNITSANDTAGANFAIDSQVENGASVVTVNGGTVTGGISSSTTYALTQPNNGTSLVTINGGSVTAAFNAAITSQTTNGFNHVVMNAGSLTATTQGITATSTQGDISVQMNGGSMSVTGAGSTGILAQGAGAINITVNGTIDPPDIGVAGLNVTPGSTAAVVVDVGASGHITANNIGVLAVNEGSGSIVVNTATGSSITQGPANGNPTPTGAPTGGIVAGSPFGAIGDISINVGGTVTAATTGIVAFSSTGNINITTGGGAIRGDSGSTGLGSAIAAVGGGNIAIATGSGAVTGGNAIFGGANGVIGANTTGNISVAVGSGGVSATAGSTADGIQTITTTGLTNITTIGSVTSVGGSGINALSVGGAISVTAGPVSGASNGIVATSSTGGVTVQTTGNITGNSGAGAAVGTAGILAGGGTTGVVNVNTTNSSNVSGFAGIIATTTGAGNVNIQTNGTVTGNGIGGFGLANSGGDGIFVSTVGGNVQIQTFGAVTGNTAPGGGDGIAVTSATGNVTVVTQNTVAGDPGIIITSGGNIVVNPFAPVTGTTNGIQTTETGTNTTSINIANTSSVTGGTNGIVAASPGGGNTSVTAGGNVTGNAGSGIITTNTGAGTTTIVTQNPVTTITGTGAGNSGISASTTGSGLILIQVAGGTKVTDPTGRAVTIDTSAGTAGATLHANGTLIGLGTVSDAVVRLLNNNSANPININVDGTINPGSATRWAVVTSLNGVNPSPNTQPVNINNNSLVNGRVFLGAGADSFINNAGATWNVSGALTATLDGPASQFGNGSTISNAAAGVINIGVGAGNFTGFVFTNTGAQTGTNTINNTGVMNSAGNVNFQFIGAGAATTINNNGIGGGQGIFNVGSVPGSTESTSFTSDGVQTVNNSGTFNVIGLGTGTAAIGGGGAALFAFGPTTVGALNFTGANGSAFNNTGLINMQADGGATRNAVTFNVTALGGTSDPNYTYTWASGAVATSAYNFVGGANSRVAVDTFLGGPGSTSDRLVIGGNISGTTQLIVNNTNPGPTTLNLTGITVAAVQGSGSNNIIVSPTSPNYVNFGPLGAIQKGFFIDPLLYVPGGATSTNGPNGNAYKFFGLPGPFAFNLPVATTAAENLWEETAFTWEDRQDELRQYFRRGIIASGQSNGGGADLRVKAPPPAAAPETISPGVWVKMVASGIDRKAAANWSQAFNNPLFGTLGTWDNSYRQTIYGVVGGVDFGRAELTSPTDSLAFGVMGGYVDSAVRFLSPNTLTLPTTTTRFNYSGGTVGVSADYMNGGFFIDSLFKADFLTLDIGGIPAGFLTPGSIASVDQNVSVTTIGSLSNVGYRIQTGRYFLEPLGTLSWVDAHVGNFSLPGAAVNVNFSNGDMLSAAGGFRAGGIVMDDRVHYVETSVTARIWDRVTTDSNVNFSSVPGAVAESIFALHDNFKGAYGEVALQLDWIDRVSGWSTFAKGDAKFNGDFIAFTGKGGIRYGF
jgi:hypothetical protein